MTKVYNGDCAVSVTDIQTKSDKTADDLTQSTSHRRNDSRTSSWSPRSLWPYILDQFIAGLLIGPLTVFCWRGAWTLLGRHLFPDDLAANGFTCAAIGNFGLIVVVFSQNFLKRSLRVDNRVHWWLGYHTFTVVCFMLNVCHWRGVWMLMDHYAGISAPSAWSNVGIGLGLLIFFRCFKNAQAPPMGVGMDTDKDFFTYTTRFRTTAAVSENHVLDVFFTVLVIHQLIVCYWRGVWNVMDVYLELSGPTASGATSVGIAFGILIVVTIAQPLLNTLYRRTQKQILRWLLEVAFFIVSNLINVCLWRGVWMLCDTHILPDTPDISCGITVAVGMIGLSLMLAGNSLTVRGCEIDGGADDSNGCMCPNRYVRYFLEQRKMKKLAKEQQRQLAKEQINKSRDCCRPNCNEKARDSKE